MQAKHTEILCHFWVHLCLIFGRFQQFEWKYKKTYFFEWPYLKKLSAHMTGVFGGLMCKKQMLVSPKEHTLKKQGSNISLSSFWTIWWYDQIDLERINLIRKGRIINCDPFLDHNLILNQDELIFDPCFLQVYIFWRENEREELFFFKYPKLHIFLCHYKSQLFPLTQQKL